jgi:hypothetical protein
VLFCLATAWPSATLHFHARLAAVYVRLAAVARCNVFGLQWCPPWSATLDAARVVMLVSLPAHPCRTIRLTARTSWQRSLKDSCG